MVVRTMRRKEDLMEATLRLYRLFMLAVISGVEASRMPNMFGIEDLLRFGGEALSTHARELPSFTAWARKHDLLGRDASRCFFVLPDALSKLDLLAPPQKTSNGGQVTLPEFEEEVVRRNPAFDGRAALGLGFSIPKSSATADSGTASAVQPGGWKPTPLRPGELELLFIVHRIQMDSGKTARDYLVRYAWRATEAYASGLKLGPALTRLCTEGYLDPLGNRGLKKRSYRLTDRGVRLADKLGSPSGKEDASLE